jgi:hypothetical protein
MQRRTRRLAGAFALIAALAAGGAAYTTSNQVPATNTAGFSNTTVTGTTVNTISNTLVTGGQNISTVTVTVAAPLAAGAILQAGFGATNVPPTSANLITCSTPTPGTTVVYTCDFTGGVGGAGGGATGYLTSAADNFSVVVSG